MDKRSITSAINGRKGGRPKELEDFEALPDENWRPIKGFDDYFVSDLGRVISIKSGTAKILKQAKSRNYFNINIYRPLSGQSTNMIHSLVLKAFIGPRPKGWQGSHIDGDTLNNRLENLTWETAKQNNSRKNQHGTVPLGEKNGFSKFTNKDILEIRRLRGEGMRLRDVADKFNTSTVHVCNICKRKVWKHI